MRNNIFAVLVLALSLYLVNSQKPALLRTLPKTYPTDKVYGIIDLAVLPSSQKLISLSDSNQINIWNPDYGNWVLSIDPNKNVYLGDQLTSLTIVQNENIAAGSGNSNNIYVFDPFDGSLVNVITTNPNASLILTTLLYNKNLVSGNQDGSVAVFNADGSLWQTFKGHSQPISALVDLPSGYLLSGSEDSVIRIWDLSQGQATIVTSLYGHNAGVTVLSAFSIGNQPKLVSAGKDNKIFVWNTFSWSIEQTFVSSAGPANVVALLNGFLAYGDQAGNLVVLNPVNGKVQQKSALGSPISGLVQLNGPTQYGNNFNGQIAVALFGYPSFIQIWNPFAKK